MSHEIAEERIERLFQLAEKRFKESEKGHRELADRYVRLAREIGMSYNLPIPSRLKKQLCSQCHSFLVPGKNCQVRINSKKENISYRCENCGEVNRYGF